MNLNKTDTHTSYIDIVFDSPPGQKSPGFVEVEDETGKSISIGTWLQRPDGYWVLRLDNPEAVALKILKEVLSDRSVWNTLGQTHTPKSTVQAIIEVLQERMKS